MKKNSYVQDVKKKMNKKKKKKDTILMSIGLFVY